MEISRRKFHKNADTRVFFTTQNKLKIKLSNSKDKLDHHSKANIHEINCKNVKLNIREKKHKNKG